VIFCGRNTNGTQTYIFRKKNDTGVGLSVPFVCLHFDHLAL